MVKPGGRVLMIVCGDLHKIDFFGFFVGAIQSVRPDFSVLPTAPFPFSSRPAAKGTRRGGSEGHQGSRWPTCLGS